MKRNFNNEDDDFRLDGYFSMDEDEDDDEDEEDDDEDYDDEDVRYISESTEIVSFAQLDLISVGLDQKLLNTAIDLLKCSFFWKFKSAHSKLKMIDETYKSLKKIMNDKE